MPITREQAIGIRRNNRHQQICSLLETISKEIDKEIINSFGMNDGEQKEIIIDLGNPCSRSTLLVDELVALRGLYIDWKIIICDKETDRLKLNMELK